MRNRRYMLKAPNHMMSMEALLTVFPGAEFIFMHRPLTEVVPSLLSLIHIQQRALGDKPDFNWDKRYILSFTLSACRPGRRIFVRESDPKFASFTLEYQSKFNFLPRKSQI